MSDDITVHVNGGEAVPKDHVDREKIVKAIGLLMNVIRGVSVITPNVWDDKLVGVLDGFIGQEWFIDLVVLALELLPHEKDPKVLMAAFKALIEAKLAS